ncbi:MAG: DUF4845 domain-containing protein [Burkholderiales bacterium]
MRNSQRGIGLGGLLVGAIILIFVSLLGLKLAPAYIEFFAIKKAVNGIASEKRGGGGASVVEIRKAFQSRADIDDITAVKPADLEITKEGSDIVITAAYRKEIKLFGNISLVIDFSATSRDQ